jgi:D-alanyl-D-alanine carboxypeptidase
MTGTTAGLIECQRVTIFDLLHGLMLPSGNDAAMTLAENFSERLRAVRKRPGQIKNPTVDEKTGRVVGTNTGHDKKSYSSFVREMNKLAYKNHLRSTVYTNPHGLADKANHSTAAELAHLANYAMKNSVFRKIVSTKTHNGITYMTHRRFDRLFPHLCDDPEHQPLGGTDVPFETDLGTTFNKHKMVWHNSNRLLTVPGFSGVKTGITATAGACLAVYYENKDIKLFTIVLGSRNIEYRWKDTRRLTLWADCMIQDQLTEGQLLQPQASPGKLQRF